MAVNIGGRYTTEGSTVVKVTDVARKDRALIDEAIRLFRDPTITADKLEKLKRIADDIRLGRLSQEEAEQRAADVGNSFGRLFATLNKHPGALALIAIFLSIIIPILQACFDDEAQHHHQAHLDRQEIVAEVRKQTEALNAQTAIEREQLEVQKRLLEALETPPAPVSSTAHKEPLRLSHPPQPQKRTRPLNRHERRKQAAQAKKKT